MLVYQRVLFIEKHNMYSVLVVGVCWAYISVFFFLVAHLMLDVFLVFIIIIIFFFLVAHLMLDVFLVFIIIIFFLGAYLMLDKQHVNICKPWIGKAWLTN